MKTLWNLVMRTRADGCTGLAGMIAYNFFLVLPVLFIFLVSVLRYLPLEDLPQDITDQLQGVLPADVVSLIRRLIEHTVERSEAQAFILITSLGASLLVMNSGYAGLISSLNRIYQLEERRRWIMVRLRALVMSVVAAALILVTFALILLAPHLERMLAEEGGPLGVLARVISLIRWPVIVALAVFGMETTFKYAPCRGPRWRFVSPGALFGTGGWVLATLAFGFYVNHFASYDQVYGALGAVIVLLTWMWMSALIFLVGAEINMMWRERRMEDAPGGREMRQMSEPLE